MDAGTSRRSTGPLVIPARGGASHSLARGAGQGGARLEIEENLLGLPSLLLTLPLYFILDSLTEYRCKETSRVY